MLKWDPEPDSILEEIATASIYGDIETYPQRSMLETGNADIYKEGAYTYDPTNGVMSQGDIWRLRH